MTKAAAIHQFFGSFGVSAYEENTVPTDAKFPYITYQLVTDNFGGEVAFSISLWYRSESWLDINAKTEEISKHISRGGKIVRCDDGAIWIKRGSPFAQSMGNESDDLIKRKYITFTAEFLTAD